MSSKDPNRPVLDILDRVKLTIEQFRDDSKTIAADERKLLLIAKAAVRMGREAPPLKDAVQRGLSLVTPQRSE